MSKSKRRQINRPGNDVGKKRQALYAAGVSQIKKAITDGYALEAIALCESMMADRLEARWAWKRNQTDEHRAFDTLGRLAGKLHRDLDEPEGARNVYAAVASWAKLRNEALHQMFKLPEGDPGDWPSRYKDAREIADSGFALSKQVGVLLKKLNKPERHQA